MVRIFLTGIDGFVHRNSDTLFLYPQENHTCSHAVQNLEKNCAKTGQYYNVSCLIPKELFNKDYPVNPKTFGEKLRKARMDAGLNIKEVAERVGVTPDTVINWELREMKPKKREVCVKVDTFLSLK